MTSADQFLTHLSASVNSGVVYVACPAPSGRGWVRERWVPERPLLSPQTYYSPCTVKLLTPHGNKVRARADDLDQCFCIVLDDVGTKVDPARIELEPTYVLETSPGNAQWGFLLREPVPAARANRIVEALIAAGWTDGGRPNLCGQVMRLPGSVNVKRDPPFIAVLVVENWYIVWSINDFEELFHLTGDVPVKPVVVLPCLPDGGVDPVLEWLSTEGMVLGGADARGWVPIECPWVDGHSTEGGTDYFPGAPGAFKCLHEHCAGRTTGDLKDWIRSVDAAFDDFTDLDVVTSSLGRALASLTPGATFLGAATEETLRLQLIGAMRGVNLSPRVLPDFDTVGPRQAPAKGQTVTEARVETVMGLVGCRVRYNSMRGSVELTLPNYTSLTDDADVGTGALVHACARCGMTREEAIRRAVFNIGLSNRFHPVMDWLESVRWDGIDRLPEWYETVVLRDPGHTPWKRAVMRKWLIQAVVAIGNYRRAAPVSVPYVLTLQGRERRGKSKWVLSLLPKGWVTDGLTLQLGGLSSERDSVRRATRTPIGELGELDASFRRSDHSGMKNFLSTTVDVYRDAYARTEVARPRCTAFCATVNPEGFLMGQEGESRFWVLGVDHCVYEHGINLQQLWAQGLAMVEAGESFELTVEEWAMHSAMVDAFAVETDVMTVVRDLQFRARAIPHKRLPKNNWVHANAKDLMTAYQVPIKFVSQMDLNAALAKCKFEKATVMGKTGFWLPPYTGELSAEAARMAELGLRLVPKDD